MPSSFPERETKYLRQLGHLLDDDPFVPGGLDVLVGADYAWEFITEGKLENTSCPTIYLIPTTLGFMLGGRIDGEGSEIESTAMLCICEERKTLPQTNEKVAMRRSKSLTRRLHGNIAPGAQYRSISKPVRSK